MVIQVDKYKNETYFLKSFHSLVEDLHSSCFHHFCSMTYHLSLISYNITYIFITSYHFAFPYCVNTITIHYSYINIFSTQAEVSCLFQNIQTPISILKQKNRTLLKNKQTYIYSKAKNVKY